jgi:hypothetical protein
MGHIPKPILDTIKSVVPNLANFIVAPKVVSMRTLEVSLYISDMSMVFHGIKIPLPKVVNLNQNFTTLPCNAEDSAASATRSASNAASGLPNSEFFPFLISKINCRYSSRNAPRLTPL